jgi:hypothetical protein
MCSSLARTDGAIGVCLSNKIHGGFNKFFLHRLDRDNFNTWKGAIEGYVGLTGRG